MKINIFPFIWKQLRGPQITAIAKAVHEWIVSHFEEKLDYYDNLAIDTAEEEHLSTLGMLAGYARPNVTMPSENDFWFTDEISYHKDIHGFSDNPAQLNEDGILMGGKLTNIKAGTPGMSIKLPLKLYTQVLDSLTTSDGRAGSLVLLDDFMALFWDFYQYRLPLYEYEIIRTGTKNRSPGDIEIMLGSGKLWADGAQAMGSVISSVDSSLYSPDPRLIPVFNEGGQYIETEDGYILGDENDEGMRTEEEVIH